MTVLLGGCSAGGGAVTPGVAREALAAPGPLAPGRSTITGQYAYATPDEGELRIPLTLDICGTGELCVQEPSMLKGHAEVHIKYSKRRNRVDVYGHFKGLPYRPTYTKDFDNSNPFNKQFVTVKDGHYQLWLVGTLYGRQHEDMYYDLKTLQFLGTIYDFQPIGTRPFPAAGTFFTFPAPVLQMICSPEFEPTPDGEAHVHFKLQYDHMADAMGSPGTIQTAIPFNLCEVDHYDNYYTNAMLPDSKFMTWDTFLQSIWNGEGILIATTVEPDPKPEELAFRDNTFVAWGNFYPNFYPKGFGINPLSQSIQPLTGHTHQWPLFPPSRRHLCGGG